MKFNTKLSVIAFWSLLALGGAAIQNAHAGVKEFYFQRAQMLRREWLFNAKAAKIPDQWFDQTLDHSNAQDMRTFKQRYWFDPSYAKGPGSPVLFYICGEATCSADEMEAFTASRAQALGAYVIALEHRYYGKSQPFPLLTTANLRYLTIANALGDLAGFERFARAKYGLTGKWISIGGSYPGALSAFYRTKYPQMVVGSLASSAPVQARDNFEEYDHHVWQVAGPQCAAVMKKVVKIAEDSLSDPVKLASVKQAFAAQVIRDNDDFLYLIADVGASAVQYGMRDPFCKALTTATDPLKAYGDFAQRIYFMWGVDALGFSVQSAENLDPNSYLAGFGYRQWMYQSCTQFGFFQNAYHDPSQSVRSQRINPTYHHNLCKRLFGLDQPVDTAGTNATYYEPLLKTASNILLTNGSDDPWSLLGINPELGNDTNPDLTALLIQGASHCEDLDAPKPTDSSALSAAKQKFLDLAKLWLQ